jgi:hypothetical protein
MDLLQRADLVVGFPDLEELPLDQRAKVGRKAGRQRLLIGPDGQVLSPLAFGDDGALVAPGDGGFDIDPAAVQRRARMAAVRGLLVEPGDLGLELQGELSPLLGVALEQVP